jgi:hypothetical protein
MTTFPPALPLPLRYVARSEVIALRSLTATAMQALLFPQRLMGNRAAEFWKER